MPGNEGIYVAKKCGSLYSFEINACTRKEVVMGFACPNNTKGNFFLKTNSEAPFGLGKQQQQQNEQQQQQSQQQAAEKPMNM